MHFSPTSCHFISLAPNILFSALFPNTLNQCSNLDAKRPRVTSIKNHRQKFSVVDSNIIALGNDVLK
jgi:hypothetical protein